MDAKKRAKYIKPVYFKNTKGYMFINFVSFGICAFSVLTGFIYFKFFYNKNRNKSFIRRYFNSEEWALHMARFRGIIPPDRETQKKFDRELDEDLDDSGLLCKSVVQKRKGVQYDNPKNSKQMKLALLEPSEGIIQKNENKIMVSIVDNDLSKKKTLSTSSSYNSKWNESSCYFPKEKSISTCPLCLKSFKSDSAYSTHMKQCAKSHKMTTQQLLEALELQKKQMQERRVLGLCSQSLPSSKKQSSKKKITNKIESCDLALGLALSKSLVTTESKASSQESQKATLEEFGFTSKSATGKKKSEHEKKSILKERTFEERQRIIVEKVAVVLLDEDQGIKLNSIELNQNSSCSSQTPQLWNMGENIERHDWYVTRIKSLVLPDEKTQEKDTALVPDNIDKEISELNLPQEKFFESWKEMINNSSKSDLIGRTKDNQNFYLHSLVLFVRYPELLEKDFKSTLEKFNLSTILIFLEYLYCGTLNGLIMSELDYLFELATELNFKELSSLLDCLKSKLSKRSSNSYSTTPKVRNTDSEAEKTIIEKEKLKFLEDKDLFSEENSINLTEEAECNESNVEKSYWSFIQHEKRKENSEKEKNNLGIKLEEETSQKQDTEILRIELSGDLITRDENAKTSSDCIVLSSGSEHQPSRTPSPVKVEYEIPYFDPYDNFHIFPEEQFSPVGLNSQSLLVGDISAESLKLMSSSQKDVKESSYDVDRETKKTIGYCSTPVTIRQSLKKKSSNKTSLEKCRKRRKDLSASRILRESLNLKRKVKTPKSNSIKKNSKKGSHNEKDVVEVLANSVLHELSKSSIFQRKNFVEITPLQSKNEFKESVTPSPNYSIMGESLLKEQLTKYGLKKNLAKSKAKKILRHIYEELHPLYNTETGKIVKMLPSDTPKKGKKSKAKKNTVENVKTKKSKNATKKIAENDLNSSKESQNSSDETIGKTENDSNGSEFEDLDETLTQSMPSNPVDLPSAFCEFLKNNPEYHQKILLYEPIWLEELQKNLKETFKKHFKMSDIMDYLDQKCITFRSTAQLKKIQKRHKKKETCKKTSPSN